MTLVTLDSPICVPSGHGEGRGGTPAVQTTLLMDAASERVTFRYQVPKTGTLAKLGFLIHTVTTARDIKVAHQALGTDGFPDSTDLSTAAIIVPTSNTWFWADIGDVSVTVEQVRALLIRWSNEADPGNLSIGSWNQTFNDMGFPSCATYNGTAWTNQGGVNALLALEYSDGSRPYIGAFPQSQNTSIAFGFDNNDTPNEYGNKFTVPFKCRIGGARIRGARPSGASITVSLYEGNATTPTVTTTLDADAIGTSSIAPIDVFFDTPVTVAAGAVVRITMTIDSITSAITISQITVDSAATMDGYQMGQDCIKCTRAGAGWTDTATQRIMGVSMLIDQLDDGAGGGSTTIFRRRDTLYVPDPMVTL
jgi:hypothetical protein